MADTDYRRDDRGRNDYNRNRKRRYRDDDDHYDARPQRRRYEEPRFIRVRKELYSIAEYSSRRPADEIFNIAKTVAEDDDEEVRNAFVQAILTVTKEQPMKIPFLAAVVLATNVESSQLVSAFLETVATHLRKALEYGQWRDFKLLLRLLAGLQGLFEEQGIFPLLNELFTRAAELQTTSSEDTVGLELVKVILLSLPYVQASSASDLGELAAGLLEKTDVIVSTPHTFEELLEVFPFSEESPTKSASALLQSQLQLEAADGWPLALLPRPWRDYQNAGDEDKLATASKHPFPEIKLPEYINPGKAPIFPELFMSVYGNQEIDSVPPLTNVSSTLLRDVLADTINALDFNRHAAAKCLIDLDLYFTPDIFVKRLTSFDKLRDIPEGESTWKPEDVAIDAIFAQMLLLPVAEHKLIYYHSLLTELCKLAPTAIAPSLGRVIRHLYRSLDTLDIELSYRFLDWFSHHLSNFGFTWKWTEWADDLDNAEGHPRKAFVLAALDKEIRLSFPARIRGTIPDSFADLVPSNKDNDTPDFKYDRNPDEAMEILSLLRRRAPEGEIQPLIERITAASAQPGGADPLLASTEVYVTCICSIGAKSLSHVLSTIERCKDRLLAIGLASPRARKQIITSVMEFWRDNPGVGVNIIDKLLNYTILTPMSVIEWCFPDEPDGTALSKCYIFEVVSTTVFKVTHRLRQLVAAKYAGISEDQKPMIEQSIVVAREEQGAMFSLIENSMDALVKQETANGSNGDTEDSLWTRHWAEGWKRVFARKAAVEDAAVLLLNEQGTRAEAMRASEGGQDADIEVDGKAEDEAADPVVE